MRYKHLPRKIGLIALLGAAGLLVASVTVDFNRSSCPARTTLSADQFPAAEGIITFQKAEAVAQWSRKYGTNCQTCHTAFPRINYFGEQFKRNGYQMPETQDGDETKTQAGNLWYDKLGNLMGIRINVTAARLEANALNTGGSRETRVSFGNTNWVQFFSAGSIFKNASIFIEAELLPTEVELNWFTLGYHNLFDTSWLNFRLGRLSPMDHVGQTGRLRMIPSQRIESISGIESGGGFSAATFPNLASPTHDDAVPLANPQPSLELFGYGGPFLYSVGVTNGANLSDTNKFKNYFSTLRLEMPSGDFAGSSVSTWGYLGWDTANNAVARVSDRFWRTAGSVNMRYKKWDVIGLVIYGKDDNWDFSTGLDQNSAGASGQVGYLWTPKWFTALQYDWVDGTDNSDNFNRITPAITFMPRENMRIDLIGRADLRNTTGGRRHEALLNIRSMF